MPSTELPTILVVEDEPALRQLLAQALSLAGFAVLAAETGEEAVGLFRPGLAAALLDVRLPGIDGVQTLAALRARDPDLPAAFVTGHAGSYSLDDLLARGAVVLPKPFALVDLQAAVRQLARGQPPDAGTSGPAAGDDAE